jgi:hypothetical protein
LEAGQQRWEPQDLQQAGGSKDVVGWIQRRNVMESEIQNGERGAFGEE